MATVKRVKIINTYYESGEPKYRAGEHYPKTEETHRLVLHGHAEEIDVEVEEPAPKAKGK